MGTHFDYVEGECELVSGFNVEFGGVGGGKGVEGVGVGFFFRR